eukprot:1383379-Prymnesium_polylepis.1
MGTSPQCGLVPIGGAEPRLRSVRRHPEQCAPSRWGIRASAPRKTRREKVRIFFKRCLQPRAMAF